MEMEAPKRKEKVHWLLNDEQHIFQKKDVEAGIIHPLVGIMLIVILRLTRSDMLAAPLPPSFTTVSSR